MIVQYTSWRTAAWRSSSRTRRTSAFSRFKVRERDCSSPFSQSFSLALHKGKYFGEYGFYTGRERLVSVRSVDFATLLKIEREEFLAMIRSFPLDEEIFHMTKDKLSEGKCFGANGVECYSCDSENHVLNTCPLVHHVPNRLLSYHKYNYNPGQTRLKAFKRLIIDKCSTLKDLDLLQEAAEAIHAEYPELIPPSLDNSFTDSSSSGFDSLDEEETNMNANNHNPSNGGGGGGGGILADLILAKRIGGGGDGLVSSANSPKDSSRGGQSTPHQVISRLTKKASELSAEHSHLRRLKQINIEDIVEEEEEDNDANSDSSIDSVKHHHKRKSSSSVEESSSAGTSHETNNSSNQIFSQRSDAASESWSQRVDMSKRKSQLQLSNLDDEEDKSEKASLLSGGMLDKGHEEDNISVQQMLVKGQAGGMKGKQSLFNPVNAKGAAQPPGGGKFGARLLVLGMQKSNAQTSGGTALNDDQVDGNKEWPSSPNAGCKQVVTLTQTSLQTSCTLSNFSHYCCTLNKEIQGAALPRASAPAPMYASQRIRRSTIMSNAGLHGLANSGVHGIANFNQQKNAAELQIQDQISKKVSAMHDKMFNCVSEADSLLMEFDRLMDYQVYFPNSNLSVVLQTHKLSQRNQNHKLMQQHLNKSSFVSPRASFSYIEDPALKAKLCSLYPNKSSSPVSKSESNHHHQKRDSLTGFIRNIGMSDRHEHRELSIKVRKVSNDPIPADEQKQS